MNFIRINDCNYGSHADGQGLKVGDLIYSYSEQRIDSIDSLTEIMGKFEGQTRLIRVIRQNSMIAIPFVAGDLEAKIMEYEVSDAQYDLAVENGKEDEIKAEEQLEQVQNIVDSAEKLENMIITTAHSVEGRPVEKTIEVITAECVFGMNWFKDLFSSISDVFGGRSNTSQNALRDARKTCINELKMEALALGANAVIGVDLDYSEISGQGKSMLFLVASGTAVKVKDVSS